MSNSCTANALVKAGETRLPLASQPPSAEDEQLRMVALGEVVRTIIEASIRQSLPNWSNGYRLHFDGKRLIIGLETDSHPGEGQIREARLHFQQITSLPLQVKLLQANKSASNSSDPPWYKNVRPPP